MNNFEFYCPTKVLFGKGMIARLPELIDRSQKVSYDIRRRFYKEKRRLRSGEKSSGRI